MRLLCDAAMQPEVPDILLLFCTLASVGAVPSTFEAAYATSEMPFALTAAKEDRSRATLENVSAAVLPPQQHDEAEGDQAVQDSSGSVCIERYGNRAT